MDWSSTQGLISISGIIWGVFSLFLITKRIIQGFWKLGLKEFWMGTVSLIGILWVCFALIFLAMSIPSVMGWIETFPMGGPSSDTLWIISILPIFYTLSGFMFIIYILVKAFTYKPKYSEKEQMFLREEKLKLKERLGWVGRFVKGGKR